jgi:hypothetical protein
MRRLVGVALIAAAATVTGGCTSVRMVQRDGCWIKRTERTFRGVREDIGPCTRPQPKWVRDQLTRLVQECVAQADHRWQVRAIEAWSKGAPYPAQPAEEEVLRTCMQEARVGLVSENGELKRQVADLSAERERLRSGAEQERDQLRASADRLASFLGEAAQRPPGAATATATANADGKATNESGATLATESSSGSGASGAPSSPAPAAPAVMNASPAPAAPPPLRKARVAAAPRTPVVLGAPRPPECEVPASAEHARTAAAGPAAVEPTPSRPPEANVDETPSP